MQKRMCASSGLVRTFIILKLYVDEVIVLIHVECLETKIPKMKKHGEIHYSLGVQEIKGGG